MEKVSTWFSNYEVIEGISGGDFCGVMGERKFWGVLKSVWEGRKHRFFS